MKKISVLIALILLCSLFSCTTAKPEPEPQPPVQPEPEPLPAPEPAAEPDPEPEEFVVTEELYVETFEDIKVMIQKLNKIIASGDFDTWLTYLTDDYIAYYSSAEQLDYFSELYRQRGYSQRINDFQDYFNYVVVLSRRNAVIDEIEFRDSTHITAYTKIKDQLSVLYYLEKQENEWKIGLKPEN